MIERSAARLGVDLSRSVLIGDRGTDIGAGRAAGVGRCFLVRSGERLSVDDEALADGVYADLAECVGALLLSEAS